MSLSPGGLQYPFDIPLSKPPVRLLRPGTPADPGWNTQAKPGQAGGCKDQGNLQAKLGVKNKGVG